MRAASTKSKASKHSKHSKQSKKSETATTRGDGGIQLNNIRKVLWPSDKDRSPKLYQTMKQQGLTSTQKKREDSSTSVERQNKVTIEMREFDKSDQDKHGSQKTQRMFKCSDQHIKNIWKVAH